jgi:hypothetical protein
METFNSYVCFLYVYLCLIVWNIEYVPVISVFWNLCSSYVVKAEKRRDADNPKIDAAR